MAILSIQNLKKTYPNGIEAVKDVSFDVESGEFLVIIGLSGSGKTTILKCINHLQGVTDGKIIFKGKDITHLEKSSVMVLRQRVAMIFQHFNLIPRHTVLSNVMMGSLAQIGSLRSILGLFPKEDKQQALDYLDLVGIADRAYERVDQLSGGQQQRVAIAKALMQNPEILLADEPVASLDPATSHTVMDYLEKINKELGITIICNLHFLSLVRWYATRVIALAEGQLVYDGDPQAIDPVWFKKIYGENAREVRIH